MDKRYQVFVSSTFTDLEEERRHVIQTLMEMDCIPAGMELFPAIDEEQWEFIKKVIDDCDYYLLIIGGRYGSIAEDGLSYTEKEFDYAVKKGLKITVLVHEDPGSLPAKKTEFEAEAREKLATFINKAQTGRLRRTWSSVNELPGLVALSMSKTIKTYPAIGWVRADNLSSESDLRVMIELQKENEELRKTISERALQSGLIYSGEIADFSEIFEINYSTSPTNDYYGNTSYHKQDITWKDLYHFLSPYIYKSVSTPELYNKLTAKIERQQGVPSDYYASIEESDLLTIELQFAALGLIDIEGGGWNLTPKGINKMMELRVIK